MVRTMWLAAVLAGAVPGDDMIDRNRELVRSLYEECINHSKWERLPELIAAEYVGPNGQRGPAAYRATVEDLKRAFPDIRFTLEDLIAEGDRVVVRWRWSGKHTAPFRTFAASHRTVTNSGIAIYQLAAGKVVGVQLETDRLGVLQQIGVVPADLGGSAGKRGADRQ